MKLGFITSNQGKLLELQTALIPEGHEVIQLNIDYPELQANSITEVAEFGLNWIRNCAHNTNEEVEEYTDLDLIFLEDSGLFIDALNGFPGVYSKFVFLTIGYEGVLLLMNNNNNRKAHFESCIAATKPKLGTGSDPKIEIHHFLGTSNGTITMEPRGDKGFGYDPIFKPEGVNQNFAEMEPEEKNKYSHRGRAIQKFVQYLKSI